MDAGLVRAQENADQAGNAYRASAAKAAESQTGTPFTAADGEDAYNLGRNQYIKTYLNNLAEGDRALMTPVLLPNAQRIRTGMDDEPSKVAMDAHNPFAVHGKEQGVHMLRQLQNMKGLPVGQVSSEMRQWGTAWEALKTQSPAYRNKLLTEAKKAGPLGAIPGPSPLAQSTKNMFAVEPAKAVALMVPLMPYISGGGFGGAGFGMAPPPAIAAKLDEFEKLRKLDQPFANMIWRFARDYGGMPPRPGLGPGK
jgi:hypothetical protein